MSGPLTSDDAPEHAPEPTAVPRRTVLRLGTAAVAGAGAGALLPAAADRAAAADLEPTSIPNAASPNLLSTTAINEAYAGYWVPPRALERWMCSPKSIRHIVCIGDSITSGKVGGYNYANGKKGSWSERLSTATAHAIGPSLGFGFRGVWLRTGLQPEWKTTGTWIETVATDPFDVGLFGDGIRSGGGASATLVWTRPSPVTVAGFDLYWFNMANAGNWQYRVDHGAWVNMNQVRSPADNKMHKFYVGQPVQTSVEVRAYNGSSACVAPIAGIGLYSADPNTNSGLIVHNAGAGAEFLSDLVKTTSGDRLSWFDSVVSNPVSLAIRPDLVLSMFSNDVTQNNVTSWRANLIKLVKRLHPYADIVLMNPYERGGFSPAVQGQYRSTTTSVATAYSCAVLDLYVAYAAAGAEGWAAANRAGLMLDNLHPSQLGHNDISARVWRLLRTFS